MSQEALTIAETVDEIRAALRDYIEATYHVGHPVLVRQRRRLLDQLGVIFQEPFLESTPRYLPGSPFEDLDIPAPAQTLLGLMASATGDRGPLVFNPPYRHQATAIEASVTHRRNLVVTTGTGSGKTESFLLPILSKLAIEAADSSDSFARPAVRALVLYPMNALVNDQLGRLRLMLGDAAVSTQFVRWSGRPARFARYTSRTLYPGVRTAKKDQERLHALGDFYVALEDAANDDTSPLYPNASRLVKSLRERGKWPAKPDLRGWYGASGQRWKNKAGDYQRAVMRPQDPELLTRHEVLLNPPDVLVTNYSMLEYMLMRPLERPIFDRTREWLAASPDQQIMLVVDEAHLYRGAAGAEVALLIRRLTSRLGISSDRLQVICTSASFSDSKRAAAFAADLTGTDVDHFETVTGDLALRTDGCDGSAADADLLAEVDLAGYYEATSDEQRLGVVSGLLGHFGVGSLDNVHAALYEALRTFGPMSQLVNATMQAALPLSEISELLFPTADPLIAARAVTALVALGSSARPRDGEPGLLPCRIHSFFRGLPGIWACLDPDCAVRESDLAAGPVGAVFAQPRDTCRCGARVFELFTCRNCGAAYARAYTDNIEQPSFLWAEPGSSFDAAAGRVTALHPLDLLLEPPTTSDVEPADLDLVTGRLNAPKLGDRVRSVFLKRDRLVPASGDDDDGSAVPEGLGEFRPCGVCTQTAQFGRTTVQDHQTKGDQPFQALIARQIQVQPPGPQEATQFAPLRGRKVLIFSDSRQTAARLAPNLQDYSMRDALRPLILRGWRDLSAVPGMFDRLSLDDLYVSILIASDVMGVRLRPKLKGTESLHAALEVHRALKRGALADPMECLELVSEIRAASPPESLLWAMNETLTSKYFGLQSLALASIRERAKLTDDLTNLPDLPIASSPDAKLAIARLWLFQWSVPGYWFRSMPQSFWQTPRGIRPHAGKFAPFTRWLGDKPTVKAFEATWLPRLLELFTENVAPKKYKLHASNLALNLDGTWAYCQTCRSTQRLIPNSAKCVVCSRVGTVTKIDPDSDPVFAARKGYYRSSSVRALATPPEPPMALIAAEHTAQLNAAQTDEVFSRAEQYELLFQDVDTGIPAPGEQPRTAVDVMSCTTTMEVGIDIGTLSGVALRNMPPARSSYQQRAGRAGRRGNAVATVIAFGSADSHDEQYFRDPAAMVRGPVDDPVLTLDNESIARRHMTAFLLQRYHQDRLPSIAPEDQPHLFAVLGTVRDFLSDDAILNRADFELWVRSNEGELRTAIDQWLPDDLHGQTRAALLDGVASQTLREIDSALPISDGTEGISEPEAPADAEAQAADDSDGPDDGTTEVQAEEDDDSGAAVARSSQNLLDRLLYKGVLPRYAFPTDVVSFHVFDRNRSTRFRPAFEYAPSQGLPVALTQYAPGKEVWIDGKLWTSGALYSPMQNDRFVAWRERRLYFECRVCRYACTASHQEAERGEKRDCPACSSEGTFGSAKNWMRPPGFAHPQSKEEGTSPEDQPAKSYATRAKLVAEGPSDRTRWESITPHIRSYFHRPHLLVTNSGPRGEGYTYCTRCGRIEPTASPGSGLSGEHSKPYPDDREPTCTGSASSSGLVLGTDFISDVLLVGLQVEHPLTLQPGYLATDVGLRTVAEALTIASAQLLQIERGELQAEYRPALTPGGHGGLEAEIYMYDTLAGGAGFSRRVRAMGVAVFEAALQLLETCPADCDLSCYRCLRSFKNRFEHNLLDRHVGSSLLRYVLRGEEPTLSKERVESSTDRLFADLDRHDVEGVTFLRNAPTTVPGLGTVEAPILARTSLGDLIIAVHAPLTPDYATDPAVRDAAEYSITTPVQLVDEILIRRHLPRASHQILHALGKA
ncbi:MAG: hypothetical protein QOG43_2959 [Actinomycetota bacterium]|jgi:ATP-dependent helicase YprA (DUF1998 family)|nr:hypothetical protein [Actinomycetota bacterium]